MDHYFEEEMIPAVAGFTALSFLGTTTAEQLAGIATVDQLKGSIQSLVSPSPPRYTVQMNAANWFTRWGLHRKNYWIWCCHITYGHAGQQMPDGGTNYIAPSTQ